MIRPYRVASILVAASVVLGSGSVVAQSGSDGLGDRVEALLAHVPESHRDACRPDLGDQETTVLMSVRCELPSGITVRYSQFDSPEALEQVFARRLELETIAAGSGDCSQAVGGEEGYAIGGEPAGRLVCYESLGYDSIDWTHDATTIYGEAFLKGDYAELHEWWATASGPLGSPAESSGNGLGAALDALIAGVPEGHRSTCLPFDGGGPEDGVVVSVKCRISPDLTVYYHQLDSPASLAAAYAADVASAGVDSDTGDCAVAVPGEQPYTIGESPAGRIVCESFFDSIMLSWTHEATTVRASAVSDRSLADTWSWWLSESGPLD